MLFFLMSLGFHLFSQEGNKRSGFSVVSGLTYNTLSWETKDYFTEEIVTNNRNQFWLKLSGICNAALIISIVECFVMLTPPRAGEASHLSHLDSSSPPPEAGDSE